MKLDTGLFPDSGWAPVVAARTQNGCRHPSQIVEAQAATLAGTMQQLIDDLPEQIALLDERATILAVNRAWKDTVEQHGYTGALPGHNYHDFCVRSAAEGYEPAAAAARALDEMSSGKRSFWQLLYNGRERWDGRDFEICFRKVEIQGQQLTIVTRFDLTEILELRRLKHDFSTSLVERQWNERQRLGRELHDSTSQVLAAIGLVLGSLRQQAPGRKAMSLIKEIEGLVGETQREIRSISYLAHPPSLDKLGLTGAMRSMVEGFARRSGLEAQFGTKGDDMPVSAAAEIAIYRLAQEALANVQRHAGATRVRLRLCFRRDATYFMVTDNGVGISDEALAGSGQTGVGLESMRVRFSEIGARLSIRRLSPGTAIIARVPKAQTIDVLGENEKAELVSP